MNSANQILVFLVRLKLVLLGFAEVLLAIKFVPSVITIGYGFFCWHVWQWFEKLGHPTSQQTAALTTVFGLATVVFGLYLNSGLNGIDWNQIGDIKETAAQSLFPTAHTATPPLPAEKISDTKECPCKRE